MGTGITLTVRGTGYPVSVNARGIFSTVINGSRLSAETLDALREQVTDLTKTALHIRFGLPYRAGTVRYGTITGIHASARALLVTWDDGSRETLRSYDSIRLLHPLMNPETAELTRLTAAKQAADQALSEFIEARVFNGWRAALSAQELLNTSAAHDEKNTEENQ